MSIQWLWTVLSACDYPKRTSWFETEHSLYKAFHDLKEKSHALLQLGFGGDADPAHDNELVEEARLLVMDTVYAGEELLLYHKRLAKSRTAYGFLHQHELPHHWDRYAETRRIMKEINQFSSDVDELLHGFEAMAAEEDEFIVDSLDLPASLEADFRLARNLFSVGFDEVGLLIAGRGLEGVLRKIADLKRISLETKSRTAPASEIDTT